nr:hypothetical protein [Tanacetum cinerariifolium]
IIIESFVEQFRIQQYLQHEHYALWEVTEFGDSYEVPASTTSATITDTTSGETGKKLGRIVTLTAEDMQKKKNDFMDVEIEQDDLNQKFLTSLAPEWRMHTIKKLEPNSQNIAFISSAKHINKNKDSNTASIPTASTNVPTASASVATISQDTACAYIGSQSSGKKISIQGSDVAGFDKSKVECFNCHKMGHFARECRAPRSQDRGRRDTYRRGSKAEEQARKALMATDGVGWDWSYMANDGEDHALVADEEAPTKFTLMANTNTESKDLSWTGLLEFPDDTITDYSRPSPTMESTSGDDQNKNPSVSETEASPSAVTPKPFIKFVKASDSPTESKIDKAEKAKKSLVKKFPIGSTKCSAADIGMREKADSSQNNIDDKGYWDRGCKITGKGTIKTSKLEFESVYFVKDLKYNLFSVSQICDNKNSVLFTKSECIVLGRDFKLLDDANILLRTPRQHNMYSIDLNNIVPFRDLTCLVAKASADESKKDVSSLRYIALPNWAHDALLEYSSSKPQDHCSTKVPEGSGNPNPTASTSNPPTDQMETLTVETLIPTVSSPIPTAYFTDSQEPSSDTRLISKRVANQEETPSLDNILSITNMCEDILGVTTNSDESNGVEADISNIEIAITASFTPTLKIHKDHPKIYASLMGFTIYQMDVKSAFLYGTIDEEVYVMQPPRFHDPEFPVKVYKVEKAMYGLHQAPRAWYGTLSKYLLKNGFQREFKALMHEKFQMNAMGELNFFLGLQVLQKEDGIFLSQDKYVGVILKKFGYSEVRSSNTPMEKENPWGKDGTGKDVDLHLYRSMIGSLMYLTASRPDIMFVVCAYARHQVTPKECHMHAVKRIFRYLKGHPKLGLWYPKESPFDLVAY